MLQVRRSPSHLQTVERGWTGVGGGAKGLSILRDFDRGGVRGETWVWRHWDKWKERACRRGLTMETDRDVVVALASETSSECGGSEMLHAFMWITDRIKQPAVGAKE